MKRKRLKLPPHVVAIWSGKALKHYFYFRHRTLGRVALPALLGSPDFWREYQACVERVRINSSEVGASRNRPGSTRSVITGYLKSQMFADLGDSTQYQRRPQLEKFAEAFADLTLGDMATADLARMLSTKPVTSQHSWRKTLTGLFNYAIAEGLAKTNPAAALQLAKRNESGGHLTWEEEHVEAYRKRWPSGTRERMALELLINTAARGGSDAVKLGRQHIKRGGTQLEFTPSKTKKMGTVVTVPILPPLAAEIALLPAGQMLFMISARGGALGGGTKSGNSTWSDFFRTACREAGIPEGYTAHGIRKYTAVQLAYASCSDLQIMSVLGDKSPAMVRVYTAAARSAIQTQNAFAMWQGAEVIPMRGRS